jgi:hypothetical protein
VLKVPLRIAVTGHRRLDPADHDGLRRTVEELFTQLHGRLPGVQVELVSGLATGADQIAAEAALAVGLKVHALLPMPLDMYLDDFDEAGRLQLQATLANSRVHCTALELPPGIDREAASAPGPARDALYVALAERLQQGTSILLAMWDGEDLGLPGGTGDTVLRYLGLVTDRGVREPHVLTLPPATSPATDGERPVFWLRTRRPGSQAASPNVAGFLGIADDGEIVVTGPQLPESLAEELERLVDYARNANSHADPDMHAWGLAVDEALSLRPAAAEALRAMGYEYRRADQLAIHHQQRSDFLFKAFSVMAAIMGFLFLVYAKIYPGKIFLAGYLVLFAAGFVLFSLATRNGWFTRHLMYRAIAESLRTRFYLTVAGIEPRGIEQHLMTLLGVRRIAGFSWIELILRACTPFELGRTHDQEACLDWVRRTWIEDQHRYFERKSHALQHAHHRLERFKVYILGSMAAAIIALIAFKAYLSHTELFGLPLKTLLVFLLGLVPFWLGVWEIYQAKMAIKELAWQYRNQLYHLERAAAALRHPIGPGRVVQVLDDAAERLLADTYLWIVQRFHREHEPPAAG